VTLGSMGVKKNTQSSYIGLKNADESLNGFENLLSIDSILKAVKIFFAKYRILFEAKKTS